MDATDVELTWIVCHRATRDVSRLAVQCPLRGLVESDACMRCRHLVTSSAERDPDRCCRADGTIPPANRATGQTVAIAVRTATPAGPARLLPTVVLGPAVRPAAGGPSAQPIGT